MKVDAHGHDVDDRGQMSMCMSMGTAVDTCGHSIPTPLGFVFDPTHPTVTLTDDKPPIWGGALVTGVRPQNRTEEDGAAATTTAALSPRGGAGGNPFGGGGKRQQQQPRQQQTRCAWWHATPRTSPQTMTPF